MTKQQPRPLPIGTRVRYIIPPNGMGNTDLEGRTGTVVYIDTTAIPITVQLDEPYPDAVPETRVRKPGAEGEGIRCYQFIPNCWFCRAENLVPLETEPAEDPPAARKGTKKKGRGRAITIVPSRETLKRRKE